MFDNLDLVVVGAGPVGCVVAERAASQLGWQALIVEKRGHLAGNCYDRHHENGVLMHQYGPHLFRTDNKEVLDYLSKFTQWIPADYLSKSFVNGKLYQFPINLITLEQFFNRSFNADEAAAFLNDKREKNIASPKNSEEQILSKIGRELYEAFYLGYTLKQWEKHPRELDAAVCGRVPIRLDRDCRSIPGKYQVMPAEGFTQMFNRMIDRPGIRLMLNVDYKEIKHLLKPRFAAVYSGPIDYYFDYRLGRLPWRSLSFEFQPYKKEFHLPCMQINYPNDFLYTRAFESKHITKQTHPYTVVSYEYPKTQGDPYYPVLTPENHKLNAEYQELAEMETRDRNVYFAGRLALYAYINTDEAVSIGLNVFQKLKERFGNEPQKTRRALREE